MKNESNETTRFSEICDWVENIVLAVVVVVLAFTFLGRTSIVNGSSMVPTLSGGDLLLVTRLGNEAKAGNIVVVTKPYSGGEPIIKRVIATEGQLVDINFDLGVVFVNGEMIDEPYVAGPTNRYFDMEFPQTVPEGCVFCLGDNRNNSYDSRAEEIGMIDTRYILGRVVCRLLRGKS